MISQKYFNTHVLTLISNQLAHFIFKGVELYIAQKQDSNQNLLK